MQDSHASETHFSNTCVFCKIIRSEEKAYDTIEHVTNESLTCRALSRR